jgi:hypothetical protein
MGCARCASVARAASAGVGLYEDDGVWGAAHLPRRLRLGRGGWPQCKGRARRTSDYVAGEWNAAPRRRPRWRVDIGRSGLRLDAYVRLVVDGWRSAQPMLGVLMKKFFLAPRSGLSL